MTRLTIITLCIDIKTCQSRSKFFDKPTEKGATTQTACTNLQDTRSLTNLSIPIDALIYTVIECTTTSFLCEYAFCFECLLPWAYHSVRCGLRTVVTTKKVREWDKWKVIPTSLEIIGLVSFLFVREIFCKYRKTGEFVKKHIDFYEALLKKSPNRLSLS